jgi:hypothetical protein
VEVSVRRKDPDKRAVVQRVKDLRRLSSRCNLYSVGPSCGSASSLVMVVHSKATAFGFSTFRCCSTPSLRGANVDSRRVECRGCEPCGGVDHGEDTLGGSGSNVNIEAILGGLASTRLVGATLSLG